MKKDKIRKIWEDKNGNKDEKPFFGSKELIDAKKKRKKALEDAAKY